MTEPVLRTRDLACERDGQRVLSDVDVEVRRGEFVLLLGGNGSGKTTLLHHLNALEEPAEGFVEVDGVDTKEDPAAVREKVGLVFQDASSQIVSERVDHDVAFGPENLGLASDEIDGRVEEALEAVGAEHLRHRRTHRLSGGELRRVALAGVLAMEPDVLALDEPLVGLDYPGSRGVLAELEKLNSEGIAVVAATHDPRRYVDVADRAVVLHDGGIAVDDDLPGALEGVEEYGVEPLGRPGGGT
ncbi:MAG: energy-coupling factor ABC transporter ATP-binding protein [Halobacteriales archaeon]